ncbi:type VI secretion system accessory protein TagJ [Novipirellula artificiosorum]|uniref:ImpE protein n=1 Tax=Novipirellula artificiosorum TaxID=2528016 RepID=A0A5C6D577_9BACT|nr:type VI secretion system accessory protein TagJ [Novipirellula artificiosorum]TWU31948.1 ImpE protein [Novipirellula artificiosorum]
MNMTPSELYQAGQLDEAVQRSVELVKKNPADSNLRFQLAELSCIAGDLERADRQMETVSNQDTQAAMAAALFRQLVRAELSRRECFCSGRMPEFIGTPSPQLQNHVRALTAIRENDLVEAAKWIGAVDESAPKHTKGWIVNDNSVTAIRDLDDVLAPILEVHTSTGKYFWIQWDQIVALEVHPPKRSIDLLWRQASLSIESGPDGEVYLPAIYLDPDGQPATDASLRLGRSTDWVESGDSIVRGRGQKTLLAGDVDLPFMSLVTIERQE